MTITKGAIHFYPSEFLHYVDKDRAALAFRAFARNVRAVFFNLLRLEKSAGASTINRTNTGKFFKIINNINIAN